MPDAPRPLAATLRSVLRSDPAALDPGILGDTAAASWRDGLEALLEIHALHLAPLETLGGAEVWQHQPEVARLKLRLERELRRRLDRRCRQDEVADPVAAMRAIAARDLVPFVYDWLADDATLDELVCFVALEGGPDAGFDDLVSLGQLGLGGIAKVTLGANYWDEMGRGEPAAVHTELHHRMVDALGVPRVDAHDQPIEGLERLALNGLLATNRALQPELLGALGLLECQAGPRCRRVVAGLRRLGAPPDALPFYDEHATADPRHGKDWLDHAVAPLVEQHPAWGPRIVQGARWRASVNRRFFDTLGRLFVADREESRACTRPQAA